MAFEQHPIEWSDVEAEEGFLRPYYNLCEQRWQFASGPWKM